MRAEKAARVRENNAAEVCVQIPDRASVISSSFFLLSCFHSSRSTFLHISFSHFVIALPCLFLGVQAASRALSKAAEARAELEAAHASHAAHTQHTQREHERALQAVAQQVCLCVCAGYRCRV